MRRPPEGGRGTSRKRSERSYFLPFFAAGFFAAVFFAVFFAAVFFFGAMFSLR